VHVVCIYMGLISNTDYFIQKFVMGLEV
jgi:hypothetical protein